ncbi:MAG: LuxR C-terminal-related transcriptional regulator [Pseudomonadota bacterium]
MRSTSIANERARRAPTPGNILRFRARKPAVSHVDDQADLPDAASDLVMLECVLPGTNGDVRLTAGLSGSRVAMVSATPANARDREGHRVGAAADPVGGVRSSGEVFAIDRRSPADDRVAQKVDKARSAISLTERQLAILSAIGRGDTNKTAARRLNVSPETVKSHLKWIFERFQVSSRSEAVEAAQRLGVI